jgi:hypothetical protein
MLTAKQHELLIFINQRLDQSGISPSFEEMKEALDLKSKSGVHRLIGALEERGFIRRLANRARALEVMKMPESANARGDNVTRLAPFKEAKPQIQIPVAANDVLEIPFHGKIAAGIPIEAAISVRRTVEVLSGGVTRLHLRLKVRPDIGGHAIVVALIDLTEASPTSSNASWRTSTELDPMLAVMAGQRVEEFLRSSIDHLIAGLAS